MNPCPDRADGNGSGATCSHLGSPRLSELCEHKAAAEEPQRTCALPNHSVETEKKKKKMQEGNTNSFKTSISPYRQHHKSFNSSLWILPLHSRFNPQTVLSAQFKNQGIEQRNELKRMVDFFFFFLKIRTRHYNF